MSGADRELASRLAKFLVVGGTGVVLNNAALYTFYQLLRLPLVVASALAVVLAIGNNYVLNDRWTFRRPRQTPSLHRFVQFCVVSLGGLAITTLTLWTLVAFLNVQYLVANAIGISLATGSNFLVNLNWTWSRSRSRSRSSEQ
jgi:dolichol-phosphate mannosyltransferase